MREDDAIRSQVALTILELIDLGYVAAVKRKDGQIGYVLTGTGVLYRGLDEIENALRPKN